MVVKLQHSPLAGTWVLCNLITEGLQEPGDAWKVPRFSAAMGRKEGIVNMRDNDAKWR